MQYKCHSTRTIIVNETWEFLTESGPRVKVGVFVIIKPRVEDIETFLKTNEDAVRDEFQKIIQMHLGYWIIQMTPEEVMAEGPELSKELANLFGMEMEITETEDWTGMSISRPKVSSIDLEQGPLKDRESVYTMEKMKEAVDKLIGPDASDEVRKIAEHLYAQSRGWQRKLVIGIEGQNGALLLGAGVMPQEFLEGGKGKKGDKE